MTFIRAYCGVSTEECAIEGLGIVGPPTGLRASIGASMRFQRLLYDIFVLPTPAVACGQYKQLLAFRVPRRQHLKVKVKLETKTGSVQIRCATLDCEDSQPHAEEPDHVAQI
jgi:hypothetical protein